MSNQLVTEPPLYTVEFNAVTGKYEDKSPFEKFERSNNTYKCSCGLMGRFSKYNEFMTHIKTKTHQEYINNYENYNKELTALKKENKNLRALAGLLEQQNTKLNVELANCEKKNEELIMIKKVFKLLTH